MNKIISFFIILTLVFNFNLTSHAKDFSSYDNTKFINTDYKKEPLGFEFNLLSLEFDAKNNFRLKDAKNEIDCTGFGFQEAFKHSLVFGLTTTVVTALMMLGFSFSYGSTLYLYTMSSGFLLGGIYGWNKGIDYCKN
ncbi:MAG: hypothetical protein U0457_19680 [Candidatus Sericytochromatia bacterium]